MSKIITGDRPKVEERSASTMIYDGCPQDHVDAIIENTKRSMGVPPEATLRRESIINMSSTKFTWTWWEITL